MTHTDLLEQMKRLELTDAQAMHLLSEARLISDNCVKVWDIAEPDLSSAFHWLRAKRIRWGSPSDYNAKTLV